ncbi:unnamed protein product [Pedinophyceae sp. YPF-701]|nr:unnamed protein product [Pedinophyceae sp. YPF-701]
MLGKAVPASGRASAAGLAPRPAPGCVRTSASPVKPSSRKVSCRVVGDSKLWRDLEITCENIAEAPPSMKSDPELASDLRNAMKALKQGGGLSKWGCKAKMPRRMVSVGELRMVGIKNPEALGIPSVRNDAAFLATTIVGSSVLAVIASQVLPGQWAPTAAYLIGGAGLIVPIIGSINPAILQFAIDRFSLVFPDYRERTRRHEAGHILIGYLCGVAIGDYSLDLGKEHTDFVESKLERRIIEGKLDEDTLNVLAVVAMAGVAAEGTNYEEVIGQSADLLLLQRLMARSETKLNDGQQMNLTRWAAWQACLLLREFSSEYEAVLTALERRASVYECIQAIEDTQTTKAAASS